MQGKLLLAFGLLLCMNLRLFAGTIALVAVPDVGLGWLFYFAEGSTQPGFTTWLLLANPNTRPVPAYVSYYKEDGTVIDKTYSLPPTSRTNILVNNEVPNAALAMKVQADYQISAERAMYSGHDGHVSLGYSQGHSWYFAEGATTPPFQMWLLLANFETQTAHVTLTFMKEDGSVVIKNVEVVPHSRKNVFVNDYFPFPGAAIATYIQSDVFIAAERSMYWGGGNDNSHGIGGIRKLWYFAEGYTGNEFHTWVLLMNPNNEATNVKLRYFKEDGHIVEQPVQVAPHSRRSVFVNDFLPGVAFSIQVESDQPIFAERAEYFGPPDARGGHVSEPTNIATNHWILAEGSTQSDFNTFILILNPNNAPANVTAKYLREDGTAWQQTYTIAPSSRFTVWVNSFMPDKAFSTDIRSDQPIVVERAMYFNGNRGGTDSIGFWQQD